MQYFWTSNVSSYLDAIAWRTQQRVPLLLPARRQRRERWQAVLKWYGFEQVDAPLGRPRVETAPGSTSSRDLLVALDPEHRDMAAAHASAMGRPFADASSGFDAARIQSQHTPTSIWLFGAPERFDCARVDALGQAIECPWGLVTAPDLATSSFVLAKLAAPLRDRLDRVTRCDILRRQIDSSTGEGPRQPLDARQDDALARALFELDHQTLVVSAHGESSHVSLQSIVLCALVDDCEEDLHGHRIDGCRRIGDTLHCKRVPTDSRRLCAVQDLRAVDLALMTCSGFAVAGDQYPSTSSLVHAAAQGYARSLLTTRESLPVRSWVGRVIAGLSRQGVPMGRIQSLGNALLAHHHGRRPWVLFGDPAPGPSLAEPRRLDGPLEISDRIEVLDPGRDLPEVISCSPGVDELVRGPRHLVVVPSPASGGTPVQLIDAGPRLAHNEDELRTWLRRLDVAAHVERSLHCYAARRPHNDTFGEALHALMKHRARLEVLHQAGLSLCEEIRTHGVWAEPLARVIAGLEAAAEAWHAQLVAMLEQFLLLNKFETTLVTGMRHHPWDPDAKCSRCAVNLKGTRSIDPVRGLTARVQTNCPNCDDLQLRPEGGAHVTVELPTTIEASQTCAVEVTLTTDTNAPPRPGWLVAVMADKGSGQTLFTGHARVTASTHTFEFSLPATISAHLHVIELAWVCDLDVTLLRRRTAGAPRPYQE